MRVTIALPPLTKPMQIRRETWPFEARVCSTSMTQPQRRFTREFRGEAVRLVETSGRTRREIANDRARTGPAASAARIGRLRTAVRGFRLQHRPSASESVRASHAVGEAGFLRIASPA